MKNNNLSMALAKAQAKIGSAPKTGYNPHFRSTFSTLEDLISVSRESLTSEGLSVSQFVRSTELGNCLITQLRWGGDTSEEVIESDFLLVLKDPTDIQKIGSAISYLKRYMYASICGIATSENEDDGNTISQPQPQQTDVFPASDAQIKMLAGLLQGKDDIHKQLLDAFKVDAINKLNSKQASGAITKLKGS